MNHVIEKYKFKSCSKRGKVPLGVQLLTNRTMFGTNERFVDERKKRSIECMYQTLQLSIKTEWSETRKKLYRLILINSYYH